MTEPSPPSGRSPSAYLPSIGRVLDFVRNILQLERSVEQLKKDNQDLEERMQRLQRQVDEQTGQLNVLVDFVTRSLDDRVAARAQDAALRAIGRFIEAADLDRRIGPWRDDTEPT